MHQHFIHRTLAIGAAGVTLLLCAAPGSASAAPKKPNACAPTYKAALEREQSGRLREARDLLRKCSARTCGELEQRCALGVIRLDVEIPSVVPVVTDETGAPVVDVQVTMDGAPLLSRLDGRAVSVDPGVHEFAFSTVQVAAFATRKVMIVQGQRGPISVSLPAPDKGGAPKEGGAAAVVSAAPPEPKAASSTQGSDTPAGPPEDRSRGGRSAFPYVLGGLGLLSVGAGGLLTYWGRKDNDELSRCSPDCPDTSVKHIRTLYIASDVAFGVGVVALGVSTILFVTSRSKEDKPPSATAFVFDVKPSSSGAFTSVSRAF